MRKVFVVMIMSSMMFCFTSVFAKSDDFPGRVKYPGIPVIELDQLYAKRANSVIVDVRSKLEFTTLRVKGSINIPVASKTFEQQVLDLRDSTDRTIVFYCNGRTCMKSFHASKKALAAGIQNIYAYDAGIFEWAVAYPEDSVLLGQSPINVKDLIAKKRFKERLLSPTVFSTKATDIGSNSMIIDVRDKYQRLGVGFFPGMERWASLDDSKKLLKYLAKAKKQNKTLYIYDEVGKQVRWLQYALEKHGFKNYYFMEKGATAYYAEISYWK